MLHFFRVVPFSCCTFLCVASCRTLFMLHFLGIQVSNFIKQRLHQRCFPVKFKNINFGEHLRTTASKNFLWNSLNVKVSQYSYITENEWSHLTQIRSSRPVVFCKKMFLEISRNSQEKHLCQSLFFNKVAGLRQV